MDRKWTGNWIGVGQELNRNWTGIGQEMDRKLNSNWTGIVQELDRNWAGIGQELDRNWIGIGQEMDRKLDRSWTGIGQELDRNWTGSGERGERIVRSVDHIAQPRTHLPTFLPVCPGWAIPCQRAQPVVSSSTSVKVSWRPHGPLSTAKLLGPMTSLVACLNPLVTTVPI